MIPLTKSSIQSIIKSHMKYIFIFQTKKKQFLFLPLRAGAPLQLNTNIPHFPIPLIHSLISTTIYIHPITCHTTDHLPHINLSI